MAKTAKQTSANSGDAKSGKVVVVRGAGALKGRVLDLDKTVDLTKPIASQVLKPAKT